MNSTPKHTPLSEPELDQLASNLINEHVINLHGLTITHHCDHWYILAVRSRGPEGYTLNSYFWYTQTLYGRWNPPHVKIETIQKYHRSILSFLNQDPHMLRDKHNKLHQLCIYYFRPKHPKQ